MRFDKILFFKKYKSVSRMTRIAGRLFWLVVLLAACKSPSSDTQLRSPVAGNYPHYAFRVKRVDKARLRFGDGDTFSSGELKIRVLGIDTPEIRNPEHGFFEDQPYGLEASRLAEKMLTGAGVIEYLPFSRDRYGRMLAHVFVDGELFGTKMIEAGLAYETVSFFGDNGFPDLAEELLRAAEKAGTPPFTKPRIWRRAHRRTP